MPSRTSLIPEEHRNPRPNPRPNLSRLHSAQALGLAALLFALSSGGPLSAGEPDLALALQEQQLLLDRAGGGADEVAGLLAGVEDTEANPRIAPRTPIPRDLPVAIFDENKVIVPEGAWGHNARMALLRRVLDADGDGVLEVERFVDPKSDLMIRQIEDRNYDGVQDTWSDFEWGAVSARVLDTNDDGNPDIWETYAEGRMTRREVDRDDDGIRDAFFIYEGDSLVKEEHDSNNDGKIDLVVRYQARRRVRSEEDQDRDGQMDLWTIFVTRTVHAQELTARSEEDTQGRGFADTFEFFEIVDDKAVLSKREQDVTGDRQIDIVSIYKNGKLVRREIADPALLPGA